MTTNQQPEDTSVIDLINDSLNESPSPNNKDKQIFPYVENKKVSNNIIATDCS